MKRFMVVVALAIVLAAVVAMAQTKEPAKAISQSEALALKIQNIGLVFQSFQQVQNNAAQAYPDYKGDIQGMIQGIVKRLDSEIKDLQKQLEEARKAEPPAKK
jgi:Skp family chaperone for outer membrane proteins